ncbi:hypothetical protein F383_32477 [Gossypium arboreum]|uniref:Uncharacterized protein n=1 Tax=Gossypium arboreum TaxID=29729 RepID=A0A0B0PLB2_GOSAR|nr:hypothetical protein F383_32477 [Gossypium arboreum]
MIMRLALSVWVQIV